MKNENNKQIEEKLFYNLCNFYYDHDAILWTELYPISLFIYKYHKLGPKGTKNLSLEIFNLYNMIKDRAEKIPSMFYDKNEDPITLGIMDHFGHHDIYNSIALKAKNARDCILSLSMINEYINNSCISLEEKIDCLLKEGKIENSLKPLIISKKEELIMNRNYKMPEDIFRKIKDVVSLLKENERVRFLREERIIKDKEKAESLNDFLGFHSNKDILPKINLNELYKQVEEYEALDSNEKQHLYECLFRLNIALINNDINLYNENIMELEQTLQLNLTSEKKLF